MKLLLRRAWRVRDDFTGGLHWPCGLDEDQVAAIAEHEHIPEMAATALANYLITHPHGGEKIRCMIVDDIHSALDDGRVRHASELFMALRHFIDQHPEARAGLPLGEP